MRMRRSDLVVALLGATSWTLAEYGLHRVAMHVPRGRGLASREHLEHHADVTYFSPASKKAASAAATSVITFPLVAAISDRRRAGAFTLGLTTMYLAYEVAHRRTHTHPPRGRYGRWARRHHLHHHFGAPMRNFGVTSPVWDRAFGTAIEPGIVVVPRRMAPVWLLDEGGEVRAEFAADYEVRGGSGRTTDPRERDRVDAFANVAPEA